jgi:metallophosphoesterase (TIGR03767 family)
LQARSGSDVLTVERTLRPGRTVRAGAVAAYRTLEEAAGEPHVTRTELTGPLSAELHARRALLTIAHLTDLHVTDVESPARFEFLNRYASDPRFRELLTMQRPQEALNARAIDAMVSAFNAIDAGPVAGGTVELAVMSGDAIDNGQTNELATFFALLGGGMVTPGSGGPELESVQAPAWPDDIFWKPDGGYGRDRFSLDYGFPHLPGVLDRAQRPFHAAGLQMPWIGCHGNHEELCQGVGVMNAELGAAMAGARKAIAVGEGIDPSTALELFIRKAQAFMAGPAVAVTPDETRSPIGLAGFIDGYLAAGGHGFTLANRTGGSAYYVHDTRHVRLVVLDTACPAGGADGSIDSRQLVWLEDRLAEVHRPNPDRLVVVVSHHPLRTIVNERAPGGSRGADLLAVLRRFRNVVLWLNGHTHINRVTARAAADGDSAGFWEVTTASMVDWPTQARLVEIFDAGGGKLGIACTMVDHDGAVDPDGAMTGVELAGLHRELAANDPLAGSASSRAGTVADRNVILALLAPFPLE